jgi:hypothetical protein
VRPKRVDYFLPQSALARRFRTRLKQALQQRDPKLFIQIPRAAWRLDWVADVQSVGSGEPALKYLAAYVYRTAFSAEKIVADDGQHVTFTYRDNQRTLRRQTLTAQQFLHRFLQHVLPRGLQRVRHFGFLSAAARKRFEHIRALLHWQPPEPLPEPQVFVPQCPCCKQPMHLIGRLARPPPWTR